MLKDGNIVDIRDTFPKSMPAAKYIHNNKMIPKVVIIIFYVNIQNCHGFSKSVAMNILVFIIRRNANDITLELTLFVHLVYFIFDFLVRLDALSDVLVKRLI